jgi:hypothetical protein
MGKRGPAPKGEYADKSQVLSTRIGRETRQALKAAAASKGRTISHEVEKRLRRSFEDDDKISEAFGSRRNYALMRMLAVSMELVFRPDNPDADWLEDPWLFDQVIRTLTNLLEAVRPEGPIVDPFPNDWDFMSAGWPNDRAARAWKGIQQADASLPLGVTKDENIANRIKNDLGDIADRPHIFEGTAKDMRREADRLDRLEANKKRRMRKGGK